MTTYRCAVCTDEEELPDFVGVVFPEADVICQKCKKNMKNMFASPAEVKSETKENDMHPVDPRPELKDDAYLWSELLKRIYACSKDLYFAFHGLRCGGSKLELKGDKIEFTFSDEFNSATISTIREKYIKPNVKIIEGIMTRLAKDVSQKKSFSDCPV